MKKILAILAIGAAMIMSLNSCNEKNDPEGGETISGGGGGGNTVTDNTKLFRFAPVTDENARLVRVDYTEPRMYDVLKSAPRGLGEVTYYTNNYLLSYNTINGGLTDFYESSIGHDSYSIDSGEKSMEVSSYYISPREIDPEVGYPYSFAVGEEELSYTTSYSAANGEISVVEKRIEVEVIKSYKPRAEVEFRYTVKLNSDGTAKSIVVPEQGEVASFQWTDGNLTGAVVAPNAYVGGKAIPKNMVFNIEYSEEENPWCGVDWITLCLPFEKINPALGLLHSKNFPSSIKYDGPDGQMEMPVTLTKDASGRVAKAVVGSGEMHMTVDFFYGTHDASTLTLENNFVASQDILDSKIVPEYYSISMDWDKPDALPELSDSQNYEFGYSAQYQVKTTFQDGTERTDWITKPAILEYDGCRIPGSESNERSLRMSPQVITIDAESLDLEYLSYNATVGEGSVYQSDINEEELYSVHDELGINSCILHFSQNIDIEAEFRLNPDSGIIYFNGYKRCYYRLENPVKLVLDSFDTVVYEDLENEQVAATGKTYQVRRYRFPFRTDMNPADSEDIPYSPFSIYIEVRKAI